MSGEYCPNCGNTFVEKTAFRSGITVLTPSNEICLFTKEDGTRMLYFHIDGGGDVSEVPRGSETSDAADSRIRS